MDDIMKLCKKLRRLNRQKQCELFANVDNKTIHDISTIFHNMQYLTNRVPSKYRTKLVRYMKANQVSCKYISKRRSSLVKKRDHLQKQVGSGLFSVLLASSIPVIAQLISGALSKKK